MKQQTYIKSFTELTTCIRPVTFKFNGKKPKVKVKYFQTTILNFKTLSKCLK